MKEPEYGLTKRGHYRHRQWAVDNLDYAKTLPPDARAWLEKFNREFYGTSFSDESLHSTQEQKRACYTANNAAYRDVMSRGLVQLEESEWLERKHDAQVQPAQTPGEADPAESPQLTFRF